MSTIHLYDTYKRTVDLIFLLKRNSLYVWTEGVMAKLFFENGPMVTDLSMIQQELSSLSITVARWEIDDTTKSILEKKSLSDEEREIVLNNLDVYFQQLQASEGYQSRDLIVLHDDIPNLPTLLSKFDRAHTHDDDEVRYIVDGEGVFGFTRPDGSQIELLVEGEEYINVPKNTEHWFYLTEKTRIKAVRYFTTTEGWTPVYTDTPIRLERQ